MIPMEPSPALAHLGGSFINFRDFDFAEGCHHGYR
jgi:hypothetical protein